jgi:hypothetical protein
MDVPIAVCRADFAPADSPFSQKLARTMAGALLALLALAGLLICIRRAGGALVEPLPPQVLVGLGGLLALAALAFRFALPATSGVLARRAVFYLCWALPTAVLALWAVGLSLHEASTSGMVGLCGLMLVEEGWSWGRLWQNRLVPRERNLQASPPRQTELELTAPIVRTSLLEEPDAQLDAISQHLVRRKLPDGGETIEGWIRAEFSGGQRHATAHLAICPPLDRVPECFAEQMDGPPAQVKVAQILPYGARFEIKLDKPALDPANVIVEFSIHESSTPSP